MANVKISELPSTTAVTGSDVVPIVQSGLTKQVSFTNFLASPSLFASGIASFLATPSSANLRAALTDETGTGPAVFATSPTIDNPTVTGVVAVPDGTAAAPALTNTGDTNTGVFFPADNTVAVTTDGTERVRVDSSGNLGLGVTPSAWSGNYKGLQVAEQILSGVTGQSLQAFNARFDSGWKYINTNPANYIEVTSGQFRWYTAPFGTAGNAISFTQAMTLDASGNLGVGTTSIACRGDFRGPSGLGVQFQETSSGNSTRIQLGTSANVGYINADAGIGTIALSFLTAGTERARIDTGGRFYIARTDIVPGAASLLNMSHDGGTTYGIMLQNTSIATSNALTFINSSTTSVGSVVVSTSGTSYNTTSDLRLKENIVAAPSAGQKIDAIQIVSHDWKASGDHVEYGVIAQDLHAVAPEAVTAGDDGEDIEKAWGVDYSKLVPMLIKEIQSLRARVAALEGQ